jgi:hypothetical protein
MLTLRKIAAAEGKTRYQGKVCKACGCTERYVSNNNCFECSKKHAKAYDQRIRATLQSLRKVRS